MISILDRSPLREIVDGLTMTSAPVFWFRPRIIIWMTMPLVTAVIPRMPGARVELSLATAVLPELMIVSIESEGLAPRPLRFPEVTGFPFTLVNGSCESSPRGPPVPTVPPPKLSPPPRPSGVIAQSKPSSLRFSSLTRMIVVLIITITGSSAATSETS